MKEHKQRFMIKAVIFLFILAAITLPLNNYYINAVEMEKSKIRKEMDWQQYKQKVPQATLDYAFFGDSHARAAFNPAYLNNSYNFAATGEDYTETYFKLRKILEKDNIKIGTAVLEIDIHIFSDKSRTDERLFKDIYYYSQFVPLKTISDLKGRNLLATTIESQLLIAGKGEQLIRHWVKPREKTALYKGWSNNTGDFSKKDRQALAQNNYALHFSEEPELLEKRSLTYFKAILSMLEQEQIKVVLIIYPVSKEYDEQIIEHGISRQQHYQLLYTHIGNHTVLDYYDIFFKNPELFQDSDHLNHKGAKNISATIASALSP